MNSIKSRGLENRVGYMPNWYMLSEDFESALYHAVATENKPAIVFEFRIPIESHKRRWKGYPYLWEGDSSGGNTWYGLMKAIPSKFIKKIHKVSYDKWLQQKNDGF